MAAHVLVVLGALLGVTARGGAPRRHLAFLRGTPEVVPRWWGLTWTLGYELGVPLLLVASHWYVEALWAAGVVALAIGLIAVRVMPGLSARAAEAEIGRSVLRATHVDPAQTTASERSLATWRADLQRAAERAAEGERAARQLRRWVSSTTSPPPADAREA